MKCIWWRDRRLFLLMGLPFSLCTSSRLRRARPTNWSMASPFSPSLSNGEKMLYKQGETWFINPTEKPPEAGKGTLKTAGMEVNVDPRAEWKQIYHEVWRIERDFFYDPHHHGFDLQQAEKTFSPYLDDVASREDLNYLLREMLSYMSVGHMLVGGGTEPEIPKIKVGLLGADYKIDNDRYQFTRVYDGENWNPKLRALPQPGVTRPDT